MSAGPRSSQASLWPMRISSMSRLAFSTTLVSCLNPSPWPCLPAPPTQDLSSAGHKGSGAGAGKTWDSEPTTGLPRSSASASFLGPGRAALLRGGPTGLAALRCCCSVLRLGEVPRIASLCPDFSNVYVNRVSRGNQRSGHLFKADRRLTGSRQVLAPGECRRGQSAPW